MFHDAPAGNIRTGQNEPAQDGLYFPGNYKDEAKDFLKQHVDKGTYDLIMNRAGEKGIPSVMARIYLNEDDWKRFVWIEQHGSLEGFAE